MILTLRQRMSGLLRCGTDSALLNLEKFVLEGEWSMFLEVPSAALLIRIRMEVRYEIF